MLMHDNWYHHWVAGATLDDQLWHQALVMDRVLESLRGSEQGPNDAMMWTLLRQGVVDTDSVDKPWNRSTRSMRYSAILVGRLWGLLAGERTRVSVRICDPTTQLCSLVEPEDLICSPYLFLLCFRPVSTSLPDLSLCTIYHLISPSSLPFTC